VGVVSALGGDGNSKVPSLESNNEPTHTNTNTPTLLWPWAGETYVSGLSVLGVCVLGGGGGLGGVWLGASETGDVFI